MYTLHKIITEHGRWYEDDLEVCDGKRLPVVKKKRKNVFVFFFRFFQNSNGYFLTILDGTIFAIFYQLYINKTIFYSFF